MAEQRPLNRVRSELQAGMRLAKCGKCGCMKGTLESLESSLSSFQTEDSLDLAKNIKHWLKQMEPVKYACLGCEYCFPAMAMNLFQQAFPEAVQAQSLDCAFEVREQSWPSVPGEYFACCDGASCPVAVSTLASVELAAKLAAVKPRELCIVGKTETENIGIDKVIKNIITNPTIRVLLLTGRDPQGHHSGQTFLSLGENGVDERMRVIGSPGRRPMLRNVTSEEVEAFRKQVQVVDMMGCEDEERIVAKLRELSRRFGPSQSGKESGEQNESLQFSTVPVMVIQAQEPTRIEMDRAGYFVIIPQPQGEIIIVEHYDYDNRMLRVIEGKDARTVYWTMIENGWVTQLSHAAYLGKELARAELSMETGFQYVQDGA